MFREMLDEFEQLAQQLPAEDLEKVAEVVLDEIEDTRKGTKVGAGAGAAYGALVGAGFPALPGPGGRAATAAGRAVRAVGGAVGGAGSGALAGYIYDLLEEGARRKRNEARTLAGAAGGKVPDYEEMGDRFKYTRTGAYIGAPLYGAMGALGGHALFGNKGALALGTIGAASGALGGAEIGYIVDRIKEKKLNDKNIDALKKYIAKQEGK